MVIWQTVRLGDLKNMRITQSHGLTVSRSHGLPCRALGQQTTFLCLLVPLHGKNPFPSVKTEIRSRVDHGRSRGDHGWDIQNALISLGDHEITGTGTPITPSPGRPKLKAKTLSSLVVLRPALSCSVVLKKFRALANLTVPWFGERHSRPFCGRHDFSPPLRRSRQ